MRLSFAKEPRETGLAGVARPNPDTQIKLDGCQVGTIRAPSQYTSGVWGWSVSIMIERADNWGWVNFAARFSTEPEAREWFRASLDKIKQKYTIRLTPKE